MREFDAEHSESLGELVERALQHDRSAWNELVRRLERVVWKTVNMMSLEPDVRDDAFVATWLRLAERLGTIREPDKLPGWLVTTAANEVRQIRRHRGRYVVGVDADSLDRSHGVPVAFQSMTDSSGRQDPADRAVMADEHRRVRLAYRRLDPTCQEVLAVLVMSDEPASYDVASQQLRRPVGSLGPTRHRCLSKLREILESDAS